MVTFRDFARYILLAGTLSLAGALSAQEQELVVGHISSLSNPAATDNARDISLGYRVYFEHINANGGIHGRKLRLLHKDDNLNAQRMVELTNELIADPSVIALAGFLGTGGLTEVTKQNLPGKNGIALIAPSQGNKNIIGAENVFPFRSGYTEEVEALVREAKTTQKPRVAIVHMNIAFGPPTAKFAEQAAQDAGLEVLASVGYETTPDKQEQSLQQVIKRVAQTEPDAIILVAAGRGAFEFVKGMRESSANLAQIYGMSVLQTNDLVKLAGLDAARGVVLAQSVPYPYSGTLPLTREYLRLMRQYAPGEPVNFFTLEGFAGAKIAVEGLKRAGANPTRKKVIDALKTMGEYDLGGVSVNYSSKGRVGWRGIDLTIIGSGGKLVR